MAKDIPPWYHGRISGDDATRILTRFRQPGAFLLRDSQNLEGAYTLTVSCSVDESGKFVDVKNYRIVKNRIKGRKKFPSVKDLQKCIKEQEERYNGRPTNLVLPVERSEIEKWDSSDGNWREKFRVREGEEDEQQKGTARKQKDQDKRSHKSPFKWRTKKEKAREDIDPHKQLQDPGSSRNDSYPLGHPGSQVCESKDFNENTSPQELSPNGNWPTVDEEYNYPDANEWNDNDLARKGTKESSNESNNAKDSDHTSREIATPNREAGNQNYNEQTAFNCGIYFTTEGLIVPRNKIPKSDQVDDTKVDKPNKSSTGIYMSSSQAIGKDRESNKTPKSHEACKSVIANEPSVSNSGIYMSSSQAKDKKKDGENEPSGASTGISMSPNQGKDKDGGDKMPGVCQDGLSVSVNKPNILSTGIYMSPKQAKSSRE
ncbi:uncharacterized protein LOC114523454 [Dendronephthya gigantea]|uniref:uncharacterized protein LOC114523454 n=1 Tax=Dendronephthya gigantea TaxID=151771 RepID=UPI00106A36F2|nr:uncharacterized protein LOC114523454 [Dendronephthya gigantea]